MSSKSQLRNLFYSIDTDSTLVDSEQSLVTEEMLLDQLPPDSFWVPQVHEKAWVEHHAVVQRKSSMKLSDIRNAANCRSDHSKSYSHRFSPSLNQKNRASLLIGLPRTPKSGFADGNFRQSKAAGNGRLFRSQSEPGGKLILDVSEPGSPKVSCTGRVEKEKGKGKRTGLWSNFKSVLRSCRFRGNMSANEDNALSA